MYYLKSIKVRDYKAIKSIELDCLPEGAPWIFLTGENGFGKTVFLQAIATALQPIDNVINEVFSSSGIDMGAVAELHGGPFFGVDRMYKDDSPFVRQSNFKFLTCYGAYRLETHTESAQTEKTIEDSGINRLFYVRTFLRNIEFELLRWGLKADAQSIEQEEKDRFRKLLSSTETLLMELLDLHSIGIHLNQDYVFYVEKDEDGNPLPKVRKEELGSGYRALLGLVGDLIVRLLKTQPQVTVIKELVGIVLIDEVELHLHPKWQKLLPGILSKYFPKVQFIASTHSPIPILGAPSGSVFLKVDRSQEAGITVTRLKKLERDIKHLLPNAILTSDIFDLEDIESSMSDDLDSVIPTDDYDEIERDRERRKRLDKVDPDIFPKDLFVNS